MTTTVAFFDADENEISSTTFDGDLSVVDMNAVTPTVARIQITNNEGKTVNVTRTNHDAPPRLDGATQVNWRAGVTQPFVYKPQQDTFLTLTGPFASVQILSDGVELASGDIGGMMARLNFVARKNNTYNINITPQDSQITAVDIRETRIYSGVSTVELSADGVLLEVGNGTRIDLPDDLRDEMRLSYTSLEGVSAEAVPAPVDLSAGLWFISATRLDGSMSESVPLLISKTPPATVISLGDGEMVNVDLTGKGAARYTLQNTSRVPYLLYSNGSGGTLLAPSGAVVNTDNGIVPNPAQGEWSLEFPAGSTGGMALLALAPWLTTESPTTTFQVSQKKQQMFTIYHDGETRLEIAANVTNGAAGLMMAVLGIDPFQPIAGGIVDSVILDNAIPEGNYLVQMVGTADAELTGTVALAYLPPVVSQPELPPGPEGATRLTSGQGVSVDGRLESGQQFAYYLYAQNGVSAVASGGPDNPDMRIILTGPSGQRVEQLARYATLELADGPGNYVLEIVVLDYEEGLYVAMTAQN